MPVDLVGFAEGGDDALGERRGINHLRQCDLHDREFITAHARNRVRAPHQRAQPIGDHLQELVADRMPKRVIDVLEMVEVQNMRGDDLTAP